MTASRAALLLGLLAFVPLELACRNVDADRPHPGPGATAAPSAADARLDAFFEEVFQAELDRSPIRQNSLGVQRDHDRWDDFSDAARTRELEIRRGELERLRAFDRAALSDNGRLSYDLFERKLEGDIEDYRWRLHGYPVNQMFGVHSWLPSVLMTQHVVESEEDARAYVARLDGFRDAFAQLIADLELRADAGVIAPRFVFPRVLETCRNLVSGEPFEDGEGVNELYANYLAKVEAVGFPATLRGELRREGRRAMVESVGPAYRDLIEALQRLDARAPSEVGAWTLPDGGAYYRRRLADITTTDLTPAEIHALGRSEVDRIRREMRDVMRATEFDGTLEQFFRFLETEPRFYLSNDDRGREAYLRLAREYLDGFAARAPEVIGTMPRTRVEVRPVEAFRAGAAGKAFYQPGSVDGKRPGVFYANVHDMAQLPTYQLEALVYHEAIPGHHLEISLARENAALPRFRRFDGYTVYSEGWGLYCEAFPREMGYYADPYSNFGRLAMELWRACRLVVDTGIHEMRWTREQAIEYLLATTPNPEGDCVKAVERYIVMPGQATAYTIGKLEIERLRREAEERMKSRFDLRDFHDTVLGQGPLPMDVLEAEVLEWSTATR